MAAKKWLMSTLFGMMEAAFATDPDSTGATYKHLKVLPDVSFQPMQDVVERKGLVGDLVRQKHVMGAKGGHLSMKVELKGSGTAAASTIASIAPEADALLTALLGTVARGTGSTIASTSTTTVLNVTSGSGFAKYMMVTVNCGATYGYVNRFITSITSNALTLDRALPVAPANGTVVYASNKYTRANTGHGSMAFVGRRDDVEYTFTGCKVVGAKISGIATNGTAVLELTYECTDWTKTTKASVPSTVLSGVTAVAAPVIKGACFAVAGTEELMRGMDFDFAPKFEFQDSTCALGPAQPDSVNAGIQLVDSAPKGAVKAYYADAHMVDFAAGTENSLAFATAGNTSANAFGLYVPKAQWGQPTFDDHNGMVGETMPFMVNDNGTDPEFVLCLA